MNRPNRWIMRAVIVIAVCACAAAGEAADTNKSDAKAIELAEATVKAMGGDRAWDRTRFITWNFFGARRHVWDKHTSRIRVEWVDRDSDEHIVVITDFDAEEGRAFIDGEMVQDTDRARELFRAAMDAWINDAYWMFMPYKLRDDGVRLRYLGERSTDAGETADVIELTFEAVGNTPQNKYHVFIDRQTRLVVQWEYFREASDEEPRLRTPWTDWRAHGRIKLAHGRGDGRRMEDVGVADELPEWVFTEPHEVDTDLFE